MTPPSDSLAPRLLRPIVAAGAVALLLVYLAIGAAHLRYPYEIEWIEGGMVDEVSRLLAGGKLYVKPSLDYVPFIYAPLWFHVAAIFAKVFGPGFFAARLVSYLSSIGAMALIGAIVQKETKDRVAAIAAAGLYAATYPIAAAFYDLARVDSLFIVLLLGGLYLVRFHETTGATIGAAALFALAFLTKQSGPIVFAPVALHLLIADRRRGLVFALAGAALMGGSALLYNRATDGWFWHYVVFLPSKHELVKRVLVDFWKELALLLGISGALGVAYLFGEARREDKRFWVLAAAGMLGTALAGRMHLGGWSNVLCPAYAILAVLFGLGLHAGVVRAARQPEARSRVLVPAVLVAAIAQLGLRAYDPRPYLAPARHAEAWSALLATVQGMEGDVFVSAHGWVGPRVGKPPHAHQMAISDELRGGGTAEPAMELRREIRRALSQKRFRALVLDNPWLPKEQLDASYEKKGEVPMRESLGPVIGWKTAQPQTIWVARP